jgi:hypothetical protein
MRQPQGYGLGTRHHREGRLARGEERCRGGRHPHVVAARLPPNVERAPGYATLPVENWDRSNSCSGTSRWRLLSAPWAASSGSEWP